VEGHGTAPCVRLGFRVSFCGRWSDCCPVPDTVGDSPSPAKITRDCDWCMVGRRGELNRVCDFDSRVFYCWSCVVFPFAQVTRLAALVQQYTIAPYWSEHRQVLTQERISWTAIGRELSREPVDCYNKWKCYSIFEVPQYVPGCGGSDVDKFSDDYFEVKQSCEGQSDGSSECNALRAVVVKRAPKTPYSASATKYLKWSPDEV